MFHHLLKLRSPGCPALKLAQSLAPTKPQIRSACLARLHAYPECTFDFCFNRKSIRVFGASDKHLSFEDIEGSAQWQVAVNLHLLHQCLDSLNISNLEANPTPFFSTHLAMPEQTCGLSRYHANRCYQQAPKVQWRRNGCKKHAIPCRGACACSAGLQK